MSSFTASAHPADGLRHEIDVNGRHTIFTDEPTRLGGTDAAPAPHELLAAMLASCASTTVAMYAQRHGWVLEGLHVEVEYDSDATPRHAQVRLHLPDSLTGEQVERLRRVAETCPARRALEAGFEFDEQIARDRPAANPSRANRDGTENGGTSRRVATDPARTGLAEARTQ